MVIQGIYNNNKYFLADIPDIDVGNCVGELTVVVTIGSDTVTEVYSPDNNMIVKIQGLYELLRSYFSLPDFSIYSNEYIMNPKTVQFKFTDSSSSPPPDSPPGVTETSPSGSPISVESINSS